MNILYYAKYYLITHLPDAYYRQRYTRIREYEQRCDPDELEIRLNYYFKVREPFTLPDSVPQVSDFRKTGSTTYYLDLLEYFRFFKGHARFAYHFGDQTFINPYPTFFKARVINAFNANSVLLKLNKFRHYKWVRDPYPFHQKKDLAVWRGGVGRAWREALVRQYWDHPLCDIGQTNHSPEPAPWQKPKMSIQEQLQYKFILSIQGNDVATNLKWVMSSNSACIMPQPTKETWFMEGTLIPNYHYIQIRHDYADLEQKILYYLDHPDEAQEIVSNAHRYVLQFRDDLKEDLLCLRVMERYAELSGQHDVLKF